MNIPTLYLMSDLQTEMKNEANLTAAGRKKVTWTKKKILMVILFVIVILISIAVLIWTFVDKTFLFNLIKDYFILPLLDIGWWAYLVFLVLMVIQSLIAPIPSELILLSAGMLFTLWPGVAIGVVGSLISGVVTYFLAIKGGRPIVEYTGEYISIADRFVKVMDIWIERWGLWAILAGRAVPVIMFDPVSYAAGLSNIKWKPYTLATFIGSIPRAIIYSYLGVQLLGNHEPDYIRVLTPEELEAAAGQFNLIFYIIFGVLVVMLILATFLSKRMEKKVEIEESQNKEFEDKDFSKKEETKDENQDQDEKTGF